MIPVVGWGNSSRSIGIKGCAEKQATRNASKGGLWVVIKGCRARKVSAAERTASARPSMAVGDVGGAVKPWTVTLGGRVGVSERRQEAVMVGVELGLIRRI